MNRGVNPMSLTRRLEKAIAVYVVDDGGIKDTGQRIPLSGGPTSIRSQPR